MISISLCMIVKNEEKVIARCLDSIKEAVDEIIIVDTGSTDSTIDIIKKYNVNLYHFEWIDDFSAARNYAFSKATKDYLMWLDADDIISSENLTKLLALKQSLDETTDVVMMKYEVSFDENNNPLLSFYRERLVKRTRDFQWVGEIHEVIEHYGKKIYQDISIEHRKIEYADPKRNLRIFEKKIADKKELSPREQFYYGRELYYNSEYHKAIKVLRDFLNNKNAWVENKISGAKDLAACYYKISQPEEALKVLLESFTYDIPRAEICCDIGKYFLEYHKLPQAKYWYLQALNSKPNLESGGFIDLDCYSYIPLMQLTMICYRLNEVDLSLDFHKKVKKIKPQDPSVLFNEEFFQKIMN